MVRHLSWRRRLVNRRKTALRRLLSDSQMRRSGNLRRRRPRFVDSLSDSDSDSVGSSVVSSNELEPASSPYDSSDIISGTAIPKFAATGKSTFENADSLCDHFDPVNPSTVRALDKGINSLRRHAPPFAREILRYACEDTDYLSLKPQDKIRRVFLRCV